MDAEFELRQASPADAAAIRRLTRAAYAKWVPAGGREPKPMTADYEAAVRTHRFDLLHLDGELAALIETVDEGDVLLVENVAVAPTHQGRGLGSRLLALVDALARTQGKNRIRLYTNKLWTQNIRLYLKLGYAVDREEQLAPGLIRVHMRKTLAIESPKPAIFPLARTGSSRNDETMIASSVLDLIGDTPLIRLRQASDATGCEILGKAEFLNPGQSVKDRAALWIIRDAERKGQLRPGGRIVEGTAGNTGIGLAMVARALGYKCTIVIPRTQSQEKKDAIRLMGAELVEVDAVPYANAGNYVRYSGRLAEELAAKEPAGAIWANQFDNVANRQAHVDATGPEIWAQTAGRVDGFICAVGTGGTLAGVAEALRAQKSDVAIGLADPGGAALYEYYARGELKAEGTSISEGIGQSRITANLEGLTIDYPYRVTDEEMMGAIIELGDEGLVMGGSTGINVAGAVRMARELGPGHTIVTILADYGSRYQSKLFNAAFLKAKGLPVPPWVE